MARALRENRPLFVPKGDEHLTLADCARAKRNCALLIKAHGKVPILLEIWEDIKAFERQLMNNDNLDLEVEMALRGAA